MICIASTASPYCDCVGTFRDAVRLVTPVAGADVAPTLSRMTPHEALVAELRALAKKWNRISHVADLMGDNNVAASFAYEKAQFDLTAILDRYEPVSRNKKVKTIFTHDCDKCVPLGTYSGTYADRGPWDLYICSFSTLLGSVTLIGRFGNDGPDYMSFTDDIVRRLAEEDDEKHMPLVVALKRAIEKNLL